METKKCGLGTTAIHAGTLKKFIWNSCNANISNFYFYI